MIRLVIALIIVVVSAISYYFLDAENPITGEEQRVSLTTEQEIALGVQAAPELIRQHGGEAGDSRLQQRVDRIGQRLLAAMQALHGVGSTVYPFEFTALADDDLINAFALPGGQIFITTGMIGSLENDDQLAAVLAHEIGHVIHRHGAEQLAKARLSQGLAGAAVIASGDASTGQLAAAVSQLVNMKYGRDDEIESDLYGLTLLHQAGFEPRGMVEMLEVLAQATRGGPPEFFSTHPNPRNRVERVESAIRELGGGAAAD